MSQLLTRVRQRFAPSWTGLVRLSLPILASAGLNLLSTFTDTAVMGWSSVSGLAGVAAATAIFAVVWAVVSAAASAHQITAARAFGAGDAAEVGRSLRHCLLIVAVVSLPLAVVLYAFGEPLVAAMTGASAAAVEGGNYLEIRAFELMLGGALTALLCTFIAKKEPKRAMYAFAVANVVNVAFDVVLVLGLGWGAAGNALATLLGTAAALGLAGVQLRRWPARADLRLAHDGWHLREIRTLVGLYSPLAASALLDYVGILAVFAMLSQLGTDNLAAGRLDYTLMFLLFVVFRSFGSGAQVLIGEAVGAADAARIDGVRSGATSLMLVLTSAVAVLILAFPGVVLRCLSRFDPLIAAATPGIRVVAVFLPIMAVALVGSATLRAIGRPKLDLVANVAPVWLVQVPLTALLSLVWGWGPAGVFVGFGAYWAGRALLAARYWSRERRRLSAELSGNVVSSTSRPG